MGFLYLYDSNPSEKPFTGLNYDNYGDSKGPHSPYPLNAYPESQTGGMMIPESPQTEVQGLVPTELGFLRVSPKLGGTFLGSSYFLGGSYYLGDKIRDPLLN